MYRLGDENLIEKWMELTIASAYAIPQFSSSIELSTRKQNQAVQIA
jgi:hypothetical protein